MTYMELDMVTNMEVDTVADTEIDKVADNEVDTVADTEVDIWLSWWPTWRKYGGRHRYGKKKKQKLRPNFVELNLTSTYAFSKLCE